VGASSKVGCLCNLLPHPLILLVMIFLFDRFGRFLLATYMYWFSVEKNEKKMLIFTFYVFFSLKKHDLIEKKIRMSSAVAVERKICVTTTASPLKA
jgi:hypothetical protein